MLNFALGMVGFVSGLVIVLAAVYVLHDCEKWEVSLRSVAALLIGAGGAVRIGDALSFTPMPPALILVLPVGISLWIAHALREHARDRPRRMRRRTDWAALDREG